MYQKALPPGYTDADEVKTTGGPGVPGRILTAKHFRKGAGSAGRFHIGQIHYNDQFNLDGTGVRMREADTTLRAYSAAELGDFAGWSFGNGTNHEPYANYLPKIPTSSAEYLIYRNLFHERGTDPSTYDQFGIRPNPAAYSAVTGLLDPSWNGWINQSVVYPDQFGTDQHLRVVCKNGSLAHYAEIASMPSGLGANLVLEFEVGAANNIDVRINGGNWNRRDKVVTSDLIEIGSNGEWFYLRPFKAWDSKGEAIPIQVEFEKVGPRLIMRKLVPTAWLQDVQARGAFPVLTDASGSWFAGAGDGYVSYSTGSSGSWATAHDTATGTASNDTATTIFVLSEEFANNNFIIRRGRTPFDISSIGSGNTVSAGNVDYYCVSKADGDNDAQGYITLFVANFASNTACATTDYDHTGWGGEACDSGERQDLTGMTTSAYFTINLNSTGIAECDVTGWADFGPREGHDAEDLSIANNSESRCTMSASEETGTGQDPTLDLTYAATVTFIPRIMVY